MFKTETTHVVARWQWLQDPSSTLGASTNFSVFILRRGLVVVFSVSLLAGCVTVPSPRPGLTPSLAAQRLFFDSVPYLPVSALVQELQGRETWDAQAQICYLTSGGHELRLAPQMPVALLDGTVVELPSAPRMEQGRLLVPERVWSDWLSRWRPPAKVSPPAGERIRTIVLDPGHGGHDPGAGGRGGLKEKNVVLDVAKRLRDLLTQDGFRVILTRYDDRFIPLNGRPGIANREGADLFISIHANSSRSRAASGYEAYYLSEATDDQARALESSENASLPEEVGQPISSRSEAILWDLLYTENRLESLELASFACRGLGGQGLPVKSRGVKSARFVVLKGARMPAVLVEVGFISNSYEEARMRRPEYRQQLAEGIRKGVLSFRSRAEKEYAYQP